MKILNFILSGIIVLMLVIWMGSYYYTSPTPKETVEFPSATVLQVPIPISKFSLTDHNGEELTIANLTKKWTFMFFGYTFCPDVCPIGLVNLNEVYKNLTEKEDLIEDKFKVNTQFVFVTVDPQRDTVEILKDYIPHFNKNFIGVTGKPEMIDSLTRPMGVAYRRTSEENSDGYYLIDHSASFVLIDPLGRMRATFSPPHDPKQITNDFRNMRKKYTEECCIIPDQKLENIIFDYRDKKE
ncbi:SCO family protein [Candidatus Halobeggiatoa sp. HSG11]|nr:SCO family protein [Candidatus Halobeggiatoa sp. HSG11]